MASIKAIGVVIFAVLVSSCAKPNIYECDWRGSGELRDYAFKGSASIEKDELLSLEMSITTGLGADRSAAICVLDTLETTNPGVTTGTNAPARELKMGKVGSPSTKAYFGYEILTNTLVLKSSGINTCQTPSSVYMSSDPQRCQVNW